MNVYATNRFNVLFQKVNLLKKFNKFIWFYRQYLALGSTMLKPLELNNIPRNGGLSGGQGHGEGGTDQGEGHGEGVQTKVKERNHRFWQRDPLAILLDSNRKIEQKLDYIHSNPLQEHWNLASAPENYKWSSAAFYLKGTDEFGIVTHYKERF